MCMCVKLQRTKVANTQNILMLCMQKEFVSCIIYSYSYFLTLANYLFHCCNIIYSDGTLNPNGVRFGTAELYDIGKC